MNLIIKNGTIVADSLINNGTVIVEEGKITHVCEKLKGDRVLGGLNLDGFKTIDAGGCYVAPGLIDIHIHGCNGAELMDGTHDALRTMARYLARTGVTAFLPTTVTASKEKTRQIAELVAAFENQAGEAQLLGIHLEGPYINEAKKGAQYGAAIRTPDFAELEHLHQILGDKMRLVTTAPEIPGGLETVDWLVERSIATSIGHSDATYEEAVAGFTRGITQVTHLFNGMSGLHHRAPGVVGAALTTPEVWVQLIADLVHVHPGAIRLVLASKTADKIILISDAIQAAGLPDGEYVLGDLPVIVKNGVATLKEGNLAGSTLNLLQAVKNMIDVCGVSITDAFRMASRNPAESIGIQGKGWIQAGYDADLIILSPRFELRQTIINGQAAGQ